MKPHIFTTSAIAYLSLTSTCAIAQGVLPTDADLKSSYCMGVLEQRIAGLSEKNDGIAPQLREVLDGYRVQSQNDLDRLRSYVLPRLPHLEALGLVIAKDRGNTDYAAAQRAVRACVNSCLPNAKGLTEQDSAVKYSSCSKSCEGAEPAIERTKSCDKITWLPF